MSHEHPRYDRLCTTVFTEPVHYRRLPEPIGPFVYEGRVAGRHLELWTETGRWREDGQAHPLDLALVHAKGA